ncbi:uncharacterized protein KGF55_002869 [Candida pseudojiufengensis]|uniref:uncharacterized protein n=1 Tax=Candida pseudojiufengensis TaxID=497109 RepID=UPI002224459A|nr:uncharacterized protein KGF55_002869 [Candida pseudojiufengensis]KAI5963077.1 hypothetical protein KGF55_002869 [Candida pseudojiufengensis]
MRVNSTDELEVYDEIGRGGFGVVYRGIITKTQKEVAIKQIDLEQDTTDLIEINKEIQILSECNSPQITTYYGSFVKNYKLWVVMEFVDGGSVFELLKATGGTGIKDEKTIAYITKNVLSALSYLHSQGKIHRDLKSQNILVNKQGHIKLTDFGVSAQLNSNFSKRNTTVGTPYWMAPEVILNSSGGHGYKADIWSLGCCCYEMFHGKPPLQDSNPPMKALRLISKCQTNGDFIRMIDLKNLEVSETFRDFLSLCFVEDTNLRSNAKKLLKHKFITQKIEDGSKSIKKLITKKLLHDSKNKSSDDYKDYYASTEIQRNQEKWKTMKDDHQQVNFDISMISHSTDGNDTNGTPSPNKGSSNLDHQFQQILIKVSEKVLRRCNSAKDHRSNINELNENIMRLLTKNDDGEVVAFQYLKTLIKELTKNKNYELTKQILPSKPSIRQDNLNFTTSSHTLVNPSTMNRFDEIERSLMDSWIQRMKE